MIFRFKCTPPWNSTFFCRVFKLGNVRRLRFGREATSFPLESQHSILSEASEGRTRGDILKCRNTYPSRIMLKRKRRLSSYCDAAPSRQLSDMGMLPAACPRFLGTGCSCFSSDIDGLGSDKFGLLALDEGPPLRVSTAYCLCLSFVTIRRRSGITVPMIY